MNIQRKPACIQTPSMIILAKKHFIKPILFLLLALWILPSKGLAQSAKITALNKKLLQLTADTNKINILNELSWEYHRIDIDKAAEIAEEARDLAEKVDYKKGLSRALNLLGIVHSFKGEEIKAQQANENALKLAYEIQDSFLISACSNDLGIIYSESPNTQDKALKLYQDALKYGPTGENLNFFTLMNICIFYSELGNEATSEKYLLEAITEADKYKDTLSLISVNEYLGYYYNNKEVLDTALAYYNRALELAVQSGDRYSEAGFLSNIGAIYNQKNFLELAKDQHIKSVQIWNEMGNSQSLAFALLGLTETYIKLKEYSNAIQTGEEGLELAQMVHSQSACMSYFELLAQAHGESENFQQAFYYQKNYGEKRDSLSHQEQQTIIAEIEAKYQLDKQAKENEILKFRQEQNEAKLKYQNLWRIGSIIVISLGIALLSILFYLFQQKRRLSDQLELEVAEKTASLLKANENLQATNEELERFTFIASHDLKEPIRNIVSFSSILGKSLPAQDKDVQENLQFITKSAKHLYALISDVLEFSRINKEEFPKELVDVNEIVQNIEQTLQVANTEEKTISIKHNGLPHIQTSSTHLYLIMKNLIENGIKYNSNENTLIEIKHTENGDYHWFHIKDNGIGIPEEFHQKIFNMFTRLHPRSDYEGTGMGLAICMKILARLKGRITLESIPNQGSTFSFSLPK